MLYKVSGGIILMIALLIVVAWNFHTTVTTERTFSASEAELWKVWNDADSVQKWWGPKGYSALVVRNEVRAGGSYLWAMKSAQGKMYWSTGTYSQVVANKKLVSTISFSDENGKIIPGSEVSVPGQWPDEVNVIVEFGESAGKARVTVKEVGIPLIACPLAKIGWSQQFDKIEMLL
jgi:uncharacterized protein YndB with AHSA1/START domain